MSASGIALTEVGTPRRDAFTTSRLMWALSDHPAILVGTVLLGIVILGAVVGPLLSPFDPVAGRLTDRLHPPDGVHWMGTDLQGRDEFTRVVYAARLSLGVGVSALLIGLLVGTIMGGFAGSLGGAVDAALMRVVDVLLAFPHILLAIAIVASLGQGVPQIAIAIGVGYIGVFARLFRGSLLAVRSREYVIAARAIGAPGWLVFAHHLLPNSLTPILVYTPLALASAIVSIAGLGFLGLGPADPRTPEWGTMLSDSIRFLRDAPYLLLFPGGAIVLAVLGFNLLGDGLRETFDPKLNASSNRRRPRR